MLRRLGYVSDHELASLYRRATALVFPSWYEGFGLPVLEAMTLGCPVICSNGTSLDELGGNAAAYIDPANSGSIAEAMLRFEGDATGRKRRQLAGREAAAAFSWDRTAQETLNFYATVLDQPLNST
jgi:glycosyltransferase involved in cell wall biosynthesis